MNHNTIITGSVAYDYLMTFPGHFEEQILPDRLKSISLSFLVDSMTRQRGGTAPNIAYSLALLGGHPKLMATVGEDFEEYRTWLENKGVDTSLVRVIRGKFTASFFATTDKANAQIASFYPGAMAHAAELSFKGIEKPDLVIISPNDPTAMTAYAAECRTLDIPYLYDPSQQVLRLNGDELRRDMQGAHFLFVNNYEYGLIEKKTGLRLQDILEMVSVLVVTRGERGATIYADGSEIEVPAYPARQILDPTGVGDAFRGGFMAGWQRGFDWQLCGQMGALAATYCIEQTGTQNHTYTRSQFVQRFRRVFDDQGRLDELLDSPENNP